MPSQAFELLTPCFCAGALQAQPTILGESIRGQLHWWWRVLCHQPNDTKFVRAVEHGLLGGICGKELGYSTSSVASTVEPEVSRIGEERTGQEKPLPHPPHWAQARALLPSRNGTNIYNLEWKLDLSLGSVRILEQIWLKKMGAPFDAIANTNRLIRAWLLLGGLGRRKNRGAGSVWPYTYSPSEEQFLLAIGELGLPEDQVKVRLLGAPNDDPETLRIICSDTVKVMAGDFPLGSGDPRKSSPLQLKIGRIDNRFRIIAVHDNRNGRGNGLDQAIASLDVRGKTLGGLLATAFS